MGRVHGISVLGCSSVSGMSRGVDVAPTFRGRAIHSRLRIASRAVGRICRYASPVRSVASSSGETARARLRSTKRESEYGTGPPPRSALQPSWSSAEPCRSANRTAVFWVICWGKARSTRARSARPCVARTHIMPASRVRASNGMTCRPSRPRAENSSTMTRQGPGCCAATRTRSSRSQAPIFVARAG